VGGVVLDLQGDTASDSTQSDSGTGDYAFLDLPGENMTVTPSKVGDLNGISSLDASRISQSRVGLYTLSARQEIAADVSGNGSVSSYDASLVSQLRVSIITRFPVAESTGSDWAFDPVERSYAPLDGDRTGQDYLGILYGDVTGNWSPPGGLSSLSEPSPPTTAPARPAAEAEAAAGECTLWLAPANRRIAAGRPVTLALRAAGCSGLLSLDLSLGYVPENLTPGPARTTPATTEFTLTTNPRNGEYLISLYGPFALGEDGDLLLLEVLPHGLSGGEPLSLRSVEVNEGAIPVRWLETPAPTGRVTVPGRIGR
jgi:hypothetical protein